MNVWKKPTEMWDNHAKESSTSTTSAEEISKGGAKGQGKTKQRERERERAHQKDADGLLAPTICDLQIAEREAG